MTDQQPRRVAARAAAEAAIDEWVRTSFDDLAVFATRVGVHGPDRVLLFSARSGPPSDIEDGRAELFEVVVCGPHRQRTITGNTDDPDVWAEAVSLWTDMRDAEAAHWAAETPISLLAAVDDRLLAAYDEFFCPDHGPEPTLLVEVASAGRPAADPFEALLCDSEAGWDEMDLRVSDLLSQYGLVAPGTAEPYGCDGRAPEGFVTDVEADD